ncbi:MAG TPA: ABC transporter substrate-binding protein [bacterium]|nr:ABC transporter substrate-binding protein [bacterium]
MSLKRFLALLLVLPLAAGVGALAAVSTTQAAAGKTTLTVGVDQEVVGLDPNKVTAFSSFRRIDLLYNKLVTYDANLRVVGDLAESWDTPDARTYVFHLRKGVQFHDGQEMTADDVVFTIERILDPKTASPGRSYLDAIESVTAADRETVRIRLKYPLASLLSGLASGNAAIVEKTAVEKSGDLQKTEAGTGPFMLAEWVPDNFMRLTKNPHYFKRGLPKVDEVVFRIIPEQASLLAGVRNRSVDMATISDGSVVKQAQADRGLTVLQVPSLNLRIFSFNTTRPPFTDARVRDAIAYAIDREAIVKAAEFGLGEVSGPVPAPDKLWALPVGDFPEYHPNPTRARQMLQDAGAAGAAFKIVASPTYEGGLAVAQVIQSQLRAVGLNPTIENIEWGTYINRWVKRDFDTMVELRGGDPDPDRFLYRTFYSTGAVNNFLFKDAGIDKLLDRGRVHVAAAERKPIYDDLQKALVEKAPAVFLYAPYESQVLQPYVKGFRLIPTGALNYLEQTSIER